MQEKAKNQLENGMSRIWILFLVIGMLFLSIVYAVVTKVERNQVKGYAVDTLKFLQSTCQKYDDYQLGNLTSELQTITNKAKILTLYAGEDERSLTQYAKNQNLTGIYVMDEDLKVEVNVAGNSDNADDLLDVIQSERNLKTIVRCPRKTYADQVTIGERIYNYAIVARKDENGAIICYDDITALTDDKNEFSLASLLAGDTFVNNARIVITDDEHIIGTNINSMQGLRIDQCSVTNVRAQDELKEDKDLFQLTDQGKTWYGKHELYRNYYLYVFYDGKVVFENRKYFLAVALAIYIIACLILANLMQRNKKRKMQQMEKEYHLVNTITSIYAANLLIRIQEDRWEPIITTQRLMQVIDGVVSAKEMLQILIERLVQPVYQEGFRQFVEMATLEERLRDKKFIGYSFESEDRWYQSLLIPQRDDTGTLQSVILTFRNVTEQKKRDMEYQEKLRVTAEEAKKANAAKTDFLRRMSHDIRTPINGIRGMVNIGKTCEEDPVKTNECYDKILGASDFLLDLVNNVLDMSKLETGEIELDHKPFDLREVMDDAYLVVETQAAAHGIAIHREPLEGDCWHLLGSPLHIKQIFQNIMSNAVKYNKENGSVRVWCRQKGIDSQYVTFEFGCEDTGIGMSEEFQKRAFETFAQEQDAARTTYSGTGLGLPIAKKLVEHMGGTIDFVSEQGKGTTFTIVLRLEIDKNYHAMDTDAKVIEESITGTKILLVEDNELNMEISQYMLTEKGAIVTTAFDGQEAVQKFEESDPGDYDIILMDIMMPVMDGLEATRCIRALKRADAKTIPIIAMSANAFADDMARSKAAGMNAHLSKPLEFDEVYATIHQYCKNGIVKDSHVRDEQ